jgi:hypothetical protein
MLLSVTISSNIINFSKTRSLLSVQLVFDQDYKSIHDRGMTALA